MKEALNTSDIDVKTVNILGSEWTVKTVPDDPAFEKCQGYANDAAREIIVEAVKMSDDPLDFDMKSSYIDQQRVIRHEIVHAYLSECGLASCSSSTDSWATNEEMVDWFARMSPKIFKTYKELKVL